MIHLDNLQVFLAVARTGSLAGAAAELDVNHTTIYRRLRRYEQDLGCRLFDRSESGHSLTRNGIDMFETAERVEREMGDLLRRIQVGDRGNVGRLMVTTTHSLAEHVLMPALLEFNEIYPEIVIDLHCSQERLLIEKREADIAIRPTTNPPAHLIGRRLITDTWKMCCAKSYVDKNGIPENTTEFANHRFIVADEQLGGYATLQWLHDIVSPSQVAMVCNSVSAIYQAVSSGLGIGQLPDWVYESDTENIQCIDVDAPLVQGEIWLLFHPEMRDCTHLRTFADFTKQRLGAIEPLLTVVGQ